MSAGAGNHRAHRHALHAPRAINLIDILVGITEEPEVAPPPEDPRAGAAKAGKGPPKEVTGWRSACHAWRRHHCQPRSCGRDGIGSFALLPQKREKKVQKRKTKNVGDDLARALEDGWIDLSLGSLSQADLVELIDKVTLWPGSAQPGTRPCISCNPCACRGALPRSA